MKRLTDDAVAQLVARFRRQRPLRGGSLIVTIFGDALAPRGGAISLGSLIELCQPFGLAERLVRTSVSRLAAEDWLAGIKQGRQAEYRLSAQGRSRFAEATARIYSESNGDWDGQWTLAIVPGARGARGRRIRQRLHWAGFGEPIPGLFLHANASLDAACELLRSQQGAHPEHLEEPVLLRARSSALPGVLTGSAANGSDHVLVKAGWELGSVALAYERFQRAFTPALQRVTELSAHQAFVLRTLLIHDYRRVHLRDPLLPRWLLPADWPGHAAYELCRAIYRQAFTASEQHLSSTAATLTGALPQPAAQSFSRFGGISPARRSAPARNA